jgi:RNA ligase
MINLLEKYYNDKLLIKQNHPNLPLIIWNYSPKTQYERLWDDLTLMCRGLVTDDKGNIIARSFNKFFNLEEEKNIPNEPYEIYEKLDGSLIILFWYNNELIVSSKGSFVSDHAVQAKRIINNYDLSNLDVSKTYCFELVAPWNRIVCSYPKEDLFLLAKFDSLGNEYSIDHYQNFTLVKKYNHLNIYQIKETISEDREGVVLKFQSGKRIKIKGDEYKRLHKLVTGLSEKSILELLKNDQSLESILDKVPDEFYQWAKNTEDKFVSKFKEIENECNKVYKEFDTRKEAAFYFLQQKYPQVLFSMLDHQDITSIIWKIVEKNYEQKNRIFVQDGL